LAPCTSAELNCCCCLEASALALLYKTVHAGQLLDIWATKPG